MITRVGFCTRAEFYIQDHDGMIRKKAAVVFVPLERDLNTFEGKRVKISFEEIEEEEEEIVKTQ